MARCVVIGIAGGSASGKSTLAQRLYEALAPRSVRLLALDSYYKSEQELPLVTTEKGRVYRDYNCPEAFDWARFHADRLDAVRTHDIVIVEGLLTLWDEQTRNDCTYTVFVDCPADIRIVRRIRRNLAWGLSLDEIADVYIDLVRHRHEQFVAPSAVYADMVIDSANGMEDAVDKILSTM